MTTMKNVNPVGWFDIYVADLSRAKSFYESVFDKKLIDLPSEWGKQSMFPGDEGGANCAGALVEKPESAGSGGGTLVYFVSEDCTTEQEKVAAAGGKVLQPKMSIGEFGFIAILMDTEGNTIGLHSRS